MQINDNSTANQLIKMFADSATTNQQIDTAILKKQQEIEKGTASAILNLLKSSVDAGTSRGQFDVHA